MNEANELSFGPQFNRMTSIENSNDSHWATSPKAITAVTALGFASGYFQQFVFPAIPLTPSGDDVLWLQNGIRILGGRLPYRDYLAFTTPGIDLFYALLIRIWGARAWIPDLAMVIIGAVITLLIALISRRVLAGTSALAPPVLFIGFVLPNSLYATHHWFTMIAALGAVLVLTDGTTTVRAGVAGGLCGVAGLFTQTKAAILGAAILAFLFLRKRRRESPRAAWRQGAAFCVSAALVLAAGNAYFIRAAGLAKFLFWTIVFPVRYFPAGKPYNTVHIYGYGFGSGMGMVHGAGFLFVHALVPLIYIALFVQLMRRRIPETKRDAITLIALVGVALFLAIAPAPSPLRIFTVAPPALILLVCMAKESRIANTANVFATALALALAILAPVRFQMHRHFFLDTPSGRIAFLERDRFEEFEWVEAETRPGEAFFGNAPVCFALGLKNPTPMDYTTPNDFTRPELVADVVRDLEKYHVPFMLLLPGEYIPQPDDGATDNTKQFREYLYKEYELKRRFATGDEAWVRIPITLTREDNSSARGSSDRDKAPSETEHRTSSNP